MTLEEQRLLIVAPTGRDAPMLCEILQNYRITCRSCGSVAEACALCKDGVGALILAEEALDAAALDRLAELFGSQPAWSDIPVLLLTSNGERIHASGQALLAHRGVRGNLVIVERPMRRLTLRVAIESALRSRFRQYELRDHLEERARQDERLRQSQKMESIGILAGGVAHDFNNLLTGVLGNASLALDYLPESSPVRRPIQDVVEASERAAHLTRQLLAYAGKGRFVVEEIDLSQQIRQIAALIHTSIPNAVQVQLNLADNLPCIEADASQLQQVVMNLIINGAEAIAEGQTGTVIVTTGVQEASEKYLRSMEFDPPMDPGRYVFMEVIDSGVGMDAEMQAHIFDPFFTTKFAGRGLGLAAVLGIIRGHAGALKIYSTPGRGTTFRVLFPVSKNRDQVTKAEAVDDAHALNGGGTVLVIDDEALVRNVAKAALERSGYAVQVCADGRAGIEAFRTTAAGVSVVLLDMSMPNMSGEETYKRLMEIKSDVKVVLSSGYSEKEAVSRFAGKGLAGFIQKPYSSARLAEVIDSVLN